MAQDHHPADKCVQMERIDTVRMAQFPGGKGASDIYLVAPYEVATVWKGRYLIFDAVGEEKDSEVRMVKDDYHLPLCVQVLRLRPGVSLTPIVYVPQRLSVHHRNLLFLCSKELHHPRQTGSFELRQGHFEPFP